MAVKTKRSSVRTALLATASLALVRGAQAAPAFAYSVPSGTASGSECAALRFDATSGALLAIDNANYGAGLAAAVPLFGATDPATAFEDCKVASGYYLAAGAAGSDDGASLVVKKVPADFYSTVTSTVEVLLYADSPATWDGADASALAGTGVTKCPANSKSPAGSAQIGDCVCDDGYVAGLGAQQCVSFSVTATAAATPAAGSPAAESAGASTPIAVALAAAAAVPLLL